MISFFMVPARLKALLAGGGILLVALLFMYVRGVYLSGKLDTERAEHKATRLALQDAVKEGLRWKALAEAKDGTITGLQDNIKACLDREKEAQADAGARAKIMQDIRPVRPREANPATGEKGNEIIDEETRRRVVDRLNRPL